MIDSLIKNNITAYMLSAIEMDTLHASTDDDTIKYSVIALANLSCKKRFMSDRLGGASAGASGIGGAAAGDRKEGSVSSLETTLEQQDIGGANGDSAQMSKVDRGKIKPLIHLLDSAKRGQMNII